MSEPTKYLNKEQVYKLNEQHGYFQYSDAQGDVSRAFANDAVAAYMQMCAEASQVAARTGLTPLELEESRDALQEQIKELREALQGLDEAYCRAGSPLSRDERTEDRKRLIAARSALANTERKTT